MSEQSNMRAQGNRLFFVDNLRSAIILLVILHHVAFLIPILNAQPHPTAPTWVLGIFLLLNQGWFMGAFFLLSGYFSPSSFDRKGAGRFLADRLVRLGIPTLAYAFILGPIAARVLEGQLAPALTASPLTFGRYLQLANIGPLWFAILLLVFDVGYAAWRGLTRSSTPQAVKQSKPPRLGEIAIYVALFAAANYLIRFVLPLGKTVLQFPSLYDLPEYVSFFCIGVVAARRNWLHTITGTMGKIGLLASVLSTLFLFPIALTGLGKGVSGAFAGAGHWQSAVYGLWEAIYAVGLLLGLITSFRHYLDRTGRLTTMLARQSFAVYVVHFPIVVILAAALRNVDLEGLVRFGLQAIIAIPVCFAVAYVIRRVPLVARVV